MKICLILEGSYPYVRGGVSSWVHSFIQHSPQHEFVLWTVGDLERRRGRYQFELPANVSAVQENFLDSATRSKIRLDANPRYSRTEKEALAALMRCGDPDWSVLFNIFHKRKGNPLEFFMSEDFLEILKDFTREQFPFTGFSDLFWTIRSMFMPLLYLIGQPIPEADLYHTVSTGYAGILGSFAQLSQNKPLVVTEHGIYTREREEEILRSDWVPSYYKELWISMFYMFSRFAYQRAQQVSSLFHRASLIQQELGCPPEKCAVVPNGVDYPAFAAIDQKVEDEWVDIGAIVRIAPIKDIKTMIFSFARLKREVANARLHILGGIDDEDYYQECQELVRFLEVKDVIFHGIVNVREQLARMDFTILTSISEGQPFALIESMGARRPVVATNVGSCKELIEGDEGDTFGDAGFCVPPMHQEGLYQGMLRLARDVRLRRQMGINGQNRVRAYYNYNDMLQNYENLYQKAVNIWQASGSN